MATLVGICYKDSEKRNIACRELDLRAELFHGKDPERQISFLSAETDRRLREDTDRGFCHMRFKGNLVIEGLAALNIQGQQCLRIGDAVIEVTIAGKECHPNCPLHNSDVSCSIYKDIYFGRIVKSGLMRLEDSVGRISYND